MRSLGYTICDFITEHLPLPGRPTEAFELTDEQARFVLRWYAVDDAGGFLYRRGALQMPKGWGKSPLAAAVAICEFAGPVVFDGFDISGSPVGRPWGTGGSPPPWVQVAAASEDQATSNVYSLIWEALTANGAKAASALGVDEGRTRLYLKAQPGAKLEAVTAAAGSREGQRLTFAVLDETHSWTKESGGTRLARTVRRNAAKVGGRTLECSNAHELGEGSVAEETERDFQAGEPGVLLVAARPSAEPDPEASDDQLLTILHEVYGDAGWVDPSRILAEIRDPATPWPEALRYFMNLPSSGAGAFVDPARWAELRGDAEVPDGARVGVGFDGSDTVDATAIVICGDDGRLRLVDAWERPDGAKDWRVPRGEVRDAVESVFERYEVVRFQANPSQWRSELEEWAREYGENIVLQIPTYSTRRFTPMIDRFRTATAEGSVHHDGDPLLARHLANVRVRSSRAGYVLEKAGPERFIDAATAAVLALDASATAGPIKEMTSPGFILMDDDEVDELGRFFGET